MFTDEFLRENKRLLIENPDEQVKSFRIKCPKAACRNIIHCSEAFTKPVNIGMTQVPAFDEDGSVEGACDVCDTTIILNVTNPEFASFNKGAKKIGYKFEKANDAYKGKRIIIDEKLQQYTTAFDYTAKPLYLCSACGENAETKLFSSFKKHFNFFFNSYTNYVNWFLSSGRGVNPAEILVRLDFNCACGHPMVGYMNHKYSEFCDFEIKDFAIVNIVGSSPLEQVIKSGVYKKDDFMEWLMKLLPRWTLCFDTVYIITPFIGHQFLKSEPLVNLWFKLNQKLDHSKTRVLLRAGQRKRFITAYNKLNNQSYEELKEHQMDSSLISEVKQKNFHAKIYCGVGNQRSEVLSGSANLVAGSSMEVLHFEKIDNLSDIQSRYFDPLDIEPSNHCQEVDVSSYAILFDSRNNLGKKIGQVRTIKNTEYFDCVILDNISAR